MPSSTSSSNQRLPAGPWLLTWAVAISIGLGLVVAWEALWRARGFPAAVQNDEDAWVVAARRLDPEGTVILGTSRAQAAVAPDVWASTLRVDKPVQLAIPAGSTLPVFEFLVDHTRFRGLAVIDFMPTIEFDVTDQGENRAAPYLRAYRASETSPARWTEALLRTEVPPLAVRNPQLALSRFLDLTITGLIHGNGFHVPMPTPPYYALQRDRFRPLDFRLVDVPARRAELLRAATRAGIPADSAERAAVVERFRRAVSALEDRGGEAVFVRLHSCGEMHAIEEARYPRAEYWDWFVRRVGAPAFDANDQPELRGIECPDGSHIDGRDAGRYTAVLAGEIARLASGPPGGNDR